LIKLHKSRPNVRQSAKNSTIQIIPALLECPWPQTCSRECDYAGVEGGE
jgi:hypothetical protein